MTPKLTHKERAEKLNSELVDIQDKIEWRADLFIPAIESHFHQVANEALEEAAIKVESFDRSIRVETDNDCTAYDISAEIRALKKDQVKS